MRNSQLLLATSAIFFASSVWANAICPCCSTKPKKCETEEQAVERCQESSDTGSSRRRLLNGTADYGGTADSPTAASGSLEMTEMHGAGAGSVSAETPPPQPPSPRRPPSPIPPPPPPPEPAGRAPVQVDDDGADVKADGDDDYDDCALDDDATKGSA